jgi:hypothetical protein
MLPMPDAWRMRQGASQASKQASKAFYAFLRDMYCLLVAGIDGVWERMELKLTFTAFNFRVIVSTLSKF